MKITVIIMIDEGYNVNLNFDDSKFDVFVFTSRKYSAYGSIRDEQEHLDKIVLNKLSEMESVVFINNAGYCNCEIGIRIINHSFSKAREICLCYELCYGWQHSWDQIYAALEKEPIQLSLFLQKEVALTERFVRIFPKGGD